MNEIIIKKKINWLSFSLAILFIFVVWLCLNQKLLFGEDFISATYDNSNWKTNEGNLHTYGAWDIEAHIWKSEFILKSFPNHEWNPYWYLGMPLLKYYQSGFYIVNILTMLIFNLSAARAALLLVIFGHLLATLFTFFLCLKVSDRRVWASALCSIFLLANTFITLRSYGWEPISIVFLFFYPLTLLVFFNDATKPFRLSLIILLALSYLAHPLIFFSLCMTMGIYLFSIAISSDNIEPAKKHKHYIWQYFGAIISSLLISAVQFFPQMSYSQVTSGAHMGVSYIPFYHVQFNIISIQNFLFDMANLKGPGPIILIAILLMGIFMFLSKYNCREKLEVSFFKNKFTKGLSLVLFFMVLFYYFEKYNIFPMNLLGSIQYHRIIPEFIITAAALIASLSRLLVTKFHKILYYSLLIAFVLASFVVVYNIQTHWQTTQSISNSPEFINENVSGRISFPYTDQSLSVRSSFTNIHEVYGYYEQGITNSYADEIFSVSSGYQDYENTLLYLKSANVERFYVNMQEGERDSIMRELLTPLDFVYVNDSRYGYFIIPIYDVSYVQSISFEQAQEIRSIEPGCRIMFKREYCGSIGEEFVDFDVEENRYLEKYLQALEKSSNTKTNMKMLDPEHYKILVTNASIDDKIVVKMSYDKYFKAKVDDKNVEIEKIGPDFMLISPNKAGNYEILLVYDTYLSIVHIGGIVSIISLIVLIIFFALKNRFNRKENIFKIGDINEI